MEYTITDQQTGLVFRNQSRSRAIILMRYLVRANEYQAIHMLDVADGVKTLTALDMGVTVERQPAREVVDFYLDGTPVYKD